MVLLFATTPQMYLTNPFQHRSYVLCPLICSILSLECLYGPVSECSSDYLGASLCVYLYNRKYVWVLGPSSRWSSRGIDLDMCGERGRENEDVFLELGFEGLLPTVIIVILALLP